MKIAILTSDNSWVHPVSMKLKKMLEEENHEVTYSHDHTELMEKAKGFDVCMLLGYYKIVPPEFLKMNKINCCIHESDLPKGRGSAPLTWQILEGKNEIIITLFAVIEEVDAGDIFMKDIIHVEDTDTLKEIREKVGEKYCNMFLKSLSEGFKNHKKQEGEPMYYPRRTPKDSELNIDKTIKEQFNLLRICDYVRYPAFFYYKGEKYYLKLEKQEEHEKNFNT